MVAQEIEDAVSKCDSCAEQRSLPPRVPLHMGKLSHAAYSYSIDQFQVRSCSCEAGNEQDGEPAITSSAISQVSVTIQNNASCNN